MPLLVAQKSKRIAGNKVQIASAGMSKASEQNTTQNCDVYLVECGDVESFCKDITANQDVVWAQPNYIYNLEPEKNANQTRKILPSDFNKKTENQTTEKQIQKENLKADENIAEISEEKTKDNTTEAGTAESKQNFSYVNNDPAYKYQWGFDKQSTGTDFSINAEDAWKNDTSTQETVVAVVDSGVDYKHPDLAANMWIDGLNYLELVAMGGGQFGFNPAGKHSDVGTTEIMDNITGHGTHCASAIAAVNNNNDGVCSVGNNHIKVMGCKVFQDTKDGSYASTEDIISAYAYIIEAKKCGVNVGAISCSFGTDSKYCQFDYGFNSMLVQAGCLGMVTSMSAGNNKMNIDGYPGAIKTSPYSVVVGASNDQGKAAAFSNYGQYNVDVFAPGVDMLACASAHVLNTGDSNGDYIPWLQEDDADWYYEDYSEKCPMEFYCLNDSEGTSKLDFKLENGQVIVGLSPLKLNEENII